MTHPTEQSLKSATPSDLEVINPPLKPLFEFSLGPAVDLSLLEQAYKDKRKCLDTSTPA